MPDHADESLSPASGPFLDNNVTADTPSHPSATLAGSPVNRLVAAAKRNSHFYSPLPSGNSIRIIELQPGKDDDQISFSLHTVPENRDAVEYHALSYCWGDATDLVKVLCENTSFFVTWNLHSALWHLRSGDTTRNLWVDAICINQYDTAERNEQVSKMRQIYANARRVDVWLGPSDGDTAQAVDLIDKIATSCCTSIFGEKSRSQWVTSLNKEDRPYQVLPESSLTGLPNSSSSTWQSMARYYDRPWFLRVWVIQEVQACTDVLVYCGKVVIEWEFVALVASWIENARNLEIRRFFCNSEGIPQTETMRERTVTRRDAPFLFALLRTRDFIATDPRDKIFSLLQHQISTENESARALSASPRTKSDAGLPISFVRHWSLI